MKLLERQAIQSKKTLCIGLVLIILSLCCFLYKLNSKRSQLLQIKESITFMIVTSGKIDLLNQSISSLLLSGNIKNSAKIIVVYDGNKTEELGAYIMNEKNFNGNQIQWIITQNTIGQIACIDLAFSKVSTKYAFLSLGNWIY